MIRTVVSLNLGILLACNTRGGGRQGSRKPSVISGSEMHEEKEEEEDKEG